MNSQQPFSGTSCDILVIDNGTNYLLFGQLSQYLQEYFGLKVLYLSLIPARIKHFRDLGIEARVLDLSDVSPAELQAGKTIVSQVEEDYPHYRFWLSIKRDRILRWYPQNSAEKLLLTAATRYSAILAEFQPKLILGEISWAIEHLFFYISEERGITYRHMLNLPGRELLVAPFDVDHSAKGTKYIGEIAAPASCSTGKSYYELCGSVKDYKPSVGYFIKNFRMLYSSNDYRQSLAYRFRRVLIPLYRNILRLFEAWYAQPLPQSRDNLLMVLHVQPESTPDYVAPFYSDQLLLAERFAESLKHGQYLYVKDHPNVVSLRNLRGWMKLVKRHRVRLLKRSLSGQDILSKFHIVVSIGGTALYECSRLGIPAISMSNTFMNELPNVIDGRKFITLSDAILAAEKLAVDALTEEQAQSFLARFGVPAFIHDARIAPDVTAQTNIERLAEVVLKLLTCVK